MWFVFPKGKRKSQPRNAKISFEEEKHKNYNSGLLAVAGNIENNHNRNYSGQPQACVLLGDINRSDLTTEHVIWAHGRATAHTFQGSARLWAGCRYPNFSPLLLPSHLAQEYIHKAVQPSRVTDVRPS